MKFITRKIIRLFILTVLALSSIIILRYVGKLPSNILHFGIIQLPKTAISGLLSGIISLFCILLIFTDYKNGFKISIVLNSFSFFNWLMSICIRRSLESLPGLITVIVSLLTVITIYTFYGRLSVSNFTDYVTGQGNRRSYVKEINEHIEAKKSFTLACIEVEDFKHINDLYGIQIGDFIIQKTSEKLASILNKKDKMFRITGSTLAILFEPGESPEERLKNVIAAETVTIPLENYKNLKTETTCILNLGAGIVYSHPPYNYTKTASSVLREAETALAATRNMSEEKICIFNESMENAEIKQRESEFLVKEALKNNYFYLVYQPQFSTADKNLRGFEALIRCRKPDCSIVSPAEFIPAAEKSNLIMKIDNYVLRNAMLEFKPLLNNLDNDFKLSINISAKTMGSADFSKRLKKLIDEIQFPPENLELEITEYSFAESMDNTISNIKQLRNLGIHIALDDFGTGYTSIKQLMTLPINLLKIDKSLIDDIETKQNMRDIVDSVIYMGHTMNCEVISEGVEKEEQIEILRDHKCDFIQGFIWGKPIDFEEAKNMCQQEEYLN